MAAQSDPSKVTPKNFYLNERQELSSFDREGGGRPAQYIPIDWPKRSAALRSSLTRAIAPRPQAIDPSGAHHHFVVAIPVATIAKTSQSKKALATGGKVFEKPDFGGEHARTFRRLGMDFLEILPGGNAAVHLPSASVPQLLSTIESLPSASDRERFRWISLEKFESLAWSTRVDTDWLETLEQDKLYEINIRFQPTLTRLEVQEVLQALAARMVATKHTRLVKAGREFSGRYWCTGFMTNTQIGDVAREFTSVQAVHPPIRTPLAAAKKRSSVARPQKGGFTPSISGAQPVSSLPTVAVVDTGIPEAHTELAAYRRSGYRNPDIDPSIKFMGDHGSAVASAVVFGNHDMSGGLRTAHGTCRVLDVMISHDRNLIEDEQLIPALEAIVGTAPDVRVFNLSFDGRPLAQLSDVARREHLLKLESLDNLAFARDVILVIAAGNSQRGIIPEATYPNHHDDPRWSLGAYACSFNAAVCGSYVDVINADAVVGTKGAPSPFTRIGPGLCKSPVPGFSAPGGDCLPNYEWAPSTGIWVSTASGIWEDHCGTSVAAPLVAREAAWASQELMKYCVSGTLPFAGTVKAWLHFAAARPSLRGNQERLAKRTLGQGFPSATGLQTPTQESACFVWQTVLQGPRSVSRVCFPVPLQWLQQATSPRLRVVVSWSTPVNYALADLWACRKVLTKIRPFGAVEALRGGGNSDGGFPLVDRNWDVSLDTLKSKGFAPSEELWVFECEYEELGPYPVAMTVSPQQRVGAVLALFDEAEAPVSPQPFVQASPLSLQMDRLSQLQTPLAAPIIIKA